MIAVYWDCSICKKNWNVDLEQPGIEENYICPHCASKIRDRTLVRVFGKKTRRKEKRKALKVGKQLSA